MIPTRFKSYNFSRRHQIQMHEMLGTKVKVSFQLNTIERVLKEDVQGFFVSVNGQRVAVRPDAEMLNASANLVGLVIK